jgi:WD40 repeat protein
MLRDLPVLTSSSASSSSSLDLPSTLPPQVKFVLRGHTDRVTFVKFFANGRLLCTAGADRCIRVWSTFDGSLIAMTEVNFAICSLGCDTIGRSIAIGDANGHMKIWQLEGVMVYQEQARRAVAIRMFKAGRKASRWQASLTARCPFSGLMIEIPEPQVIHAGGAVGGDTGLGVAAKRNGVKRPAPAPVVKSNLLYYTNVHATGYIGDSLPDTRVAVGGETGSLVPSASAASRGRGDLGTEGTWWAWSYREGFLDKQAAFALPRGYGELYLAPCAVDDPCGVGVRARGENRGGGGAGTKIRDHRNDVKSVNGQRAGMGTDSMLKVVDPLHFTEHVSTTDQMWYKNSLKANKYGNRSAPDLHLPSLHLPAIGSMELTMKNARQQLAATRAAEASAQAAADQAARDEEEEDDEED